MRLLRNAIAAGFLSVAAPAWAQSLSNGEPLRFNYEYHCNGERMIVGHCRDNNPSSYCQVYYPDRTPAHPGYQVMKAETLDMLARLSACLGGGAQGASGSDADFPSSAKVPGLGPRTWLVLGADEASITFFSRDAIWHGSGTGAGWFTRVYFEPRDFGTIRDARFIQLRFAADCTNETLTMLGMAFFDSDRKFIVASAAPSHPSHVTAGREDASIWNILCGRPQRLPDSRPVVGSGEALVALAERLHQAAAAKDHSVRDPGRSAAAINAPGLGKQSWLLLYINDDLAIFFTAAAMKRSATLPDGWFTEVFTDAQHLGSGTGEVEFLQAHYQADCGSNSIKMLQFAGYDFHKKLLAKGSPSDSSFATPKPNSDQEQIFALLCGTKKVRMTDPFVGDGVLLFGLYVELQKAREKEQQGQ